VQPNVYSRAKYNYDSLLRVRQEVIEQLFKVSQPNTSLPVPVNCSLPPSCLQYHTAYGADIGTLPETDLLAYLLRLLLSHLNQSYYDTPVAILCS